MYVANNVLYAWKEIVIPILLYLLLIPWIGIEHEVGLLFVCFLLALVGFMLIKNYWITGFTDQVVGNNEASKRQRRWHTETLKVPEPQSNPASSTTPRDPSLSTTMKRSFSRSDSTASDEPPKERVGEFPWFFNLIVNISWNYCFSVRISSLSFIWQFRHLQSLQLIL